MTSYSGQLSGTTWANTAEGRVAVTQYTAGIALTNLTLDIAGTVSGWFAYNGFSQPANPHPGSPPQFSPVGGAFPYSTALAEMAIPLPFASALGADAIRSSGFADDTRRSITATWSSPDGLTAFSATLTLSSPLFRLDPPAIPNPPEGNAGTTAHVFDIIREGDLAAASVPWSVAGTGSHPANAADFAGGVLPSGTASFAAGQTSLRITVPIAGDTLREPDETYAIRLDIPQDALIAAPHRLVATISGDDGPPAPAELGAVIAGQQTALAPGWYAGPVAELEKEIILLDRGDIAITAYSDNWFIRTGDGSDAIAAAGGTNVVDGGTGSNFLSGQGAETFFLDARGLAAPVWSTVLGLDPRDAVTVWLDDALAATLHWADDLGAEGYRGLTLMVDQPGRPLALLTLPGFATEDVGARLLSDRGTTIDGNAYLSLRVDPAWS